MIFDPVYRYIGNRLSPAGVEARLSILIYHRVLPETDPIFPYEPTVESFDAQMRRLRRVFNVLPLPEAVDQLKEGTLPARAVCITFDDGYADNVTLALPILQKHGLHATFFIATAYLDGGRMFNDTVIEAIRRADRPHADLTSLGLGMHDLSTPEVKARAIGHILPKVKYLPLGEREATVAEVAKHLTQAALPDDLMMSTGQLLRLHEAGMEIGGHTARHPILAKLDAAAARAEIAAGKAWLESTLDTRVRLFAYPNGKPGTDYRPDQAAIVRSLGFTAAVSTSPGVATNSSDLFHLPRYTPWSPKPGHFVPSLLSHLRTIGRATAAH
jgi:peptidoglycan/xylan/chitin deacetylase (PgdA/CDA1 family)